MFTQTEANLTWWEKLFAQLLLYIPHRTPSQDQSPETYAEWEIVKTQQLMGLFQPKIGSLNDARILDVGCGMGGSAVHMAQQEALDVFGVEIAPDRLQIAKDFIACQGVSNVKLYAADAACLPFDNSSFDLIVTFYVFEHINKPETVLRELWRVLKPGGVLVMVFPTWYGPWAGHLNSLFPIPWLHLLFPEKVLVYAWKLRFRNLWDSGQIKIGWRSPDDLQDITTLRELAYLNGLTLADFEKLMASTIPVKPLLCQPKSPKGFKWLFDALFNIPIVREFIVSSLLVAWKK